MPKLSLLCLPMVCLAAPTLRAQAAANPLATSTRRMYEPVKANIVATAEKIPDSLFTFRPTPQVRTVAEQLAHVANAEFTICAAALGEANPQPSNLEGRSWAPAELRRVVRESFALCDRAYAALTDQSLLQSIEFFGGQATRHFALTYNVVHANEHYGNLVTYMRV